MNKTIFGKSATPIAERLNIDQLNARDGDHRTPQEIARDDARATAAYRLTAARTYLETTRRTSFNPMALRIAEKQLADAERVAKAAGVPL